MLATGDLTDAKTKDAIGSQQYESEWRHYRDILKEFDISKKTVWLDIRGNHGKLPNKHNLHLSNHLYKLRLIILQYIFIRVAFFLIDLI